MCKRFVAAVLLLLFGFTPVLSHSKEPIQIAVREGRMSATIDEQPLFEVLSALAAKIPIQVEVPFQLRQSKVNLRVVEAPITQGLQALLRGYSFALHEDRSQPDQLVQYRIFLLGYDGAKVPSGASPAKLRPSSHRSGGPSQAEQEVRLDDLEPSSREPELSADTLELLSEEEREVVVDQLGIW